ncbi:hypothetical protein IWQ62_000306 [Dispira parvispora]|uniref:Uncharacterized protein n=1 Tax=Dispira parvispora TaxID=1520584 RepID=A0A9W8B0E1_9FUNG|nr:hypothetical protein IWQ62_000306 [Dispira parvispora]
MVNPSHTAYPTNSYHRETGRPRSPLSTPSRYQGSSAHSPRTSSASPRLIKYTSPYQQQQSSQTISAQGAPSSSEYRDAAGAPPNQSNLESHYIVSNPDSHYPSSDTSSNHTLFPLMEKVKPSRSPNWNFTEKKTLLEQVLHYMPQVTNRDDHWRLISNQLGKQCGRTWETSQIKQQLRDLKKKFHRVQGNGIQNPSAVFEFYDLVKRILEKEQFYTSPTSGPTPMGPAEKTLDLTASSPLPTPTSSSSTTTTIPSSTPAGGNPASNPPLALNSLPVTSRAQSYSQPSCASTAFSSNSERLGPASNLERSMPWVDRPTYTRPIASGSFSTRTSPYPILRKRPGSASPSESHRRQPPSISLQYAIPSDSTSGNRPFALPPLSITSPTSGTYPQLPSNQGPRAIPPMRTSRSGGNTGLLPSLLPPSEMSRTERPHHALTTGNFERLERSVDDIRSTVTTLMALQQENMSLLQKQFESNESFKQQVLELLRVHTVSVPEESKSTESSGK